MEPVTLFNNWMNEMIRRRAGEGDQMDPWKDRPGWRTELRWGVATSIATLLVLLALPLLWVVGRCISATNE